MALGNINMKTMLDLSGSSELAVSEQRMKTVAHMDGVICVGQHPKLC